jgi:D-xylose transport system substrate-binding protein
VKHTKLIALAAIAVAAAACGGSSTGTTAPAATAAPAATQAPAASEAPAGSAAASACKVYFLLPNTTTVRFERFDGPMFTEALKKYAPDCELAIQNAGGDPAKQQQQVEDAISNKASVIVLTSADAPLAAGSLKAAADANIPVLLYDHDAQGGTAAAQVVFDSLAVGEAQGKRAAEVIGKVGKDKVVIGRIMGNAGEYGTTQYTKGQDEFLQPLIDSGKVEVACQQNTPNWDPANAQAFAEDCLSKTNNGIDVFVGMNDGTTGGAVAALITQNLAGKVAVTGGQDATVEALRYIVEGYQDNTVFKNLALEADAAAKIAASLAAGKGVPQDMVKGEIDNGTTKYPAVFLPVENITIDNIQDVVDAGFTTWKDICSTGAETSEVCKAHQ